MSQSLTEHEIYKILMHKKSWQWESAHTSKNWKLEYFLSWKFDAESRLWIFPNACLLNTDHAFSFRLLLLFVSKMFWNF